MAKVIKPKVPTGNEKRVVQVWIEKEVKGNIQYRLTVQLPQSIDPQDEEAVAQYVLRNNFIEHALPHGIKWENFNQAKIDVVSVAEHTEVIEGQYISLSDLKECGKHPYIDYSEIEDNPYEEDQDIKNRMDEEEREEREMMEATEEEDRRQTKAMENEENFREGSEDDENGWDGEPEPFTWAEAMRMAGILPVGYVEDDDVPF